MLDSPDTTHPSESISVKSLVQVLELAVPALEIKTANLEAAMGEELYVTEKVYERVANGESFRDAYGKVKAEFFAKKRIQPY